MGIATRCLMVFNISLEPVPHDADKELRDGILRIIERQLPFPQFSEENLKSILNDILGIEAYRKPRGQAPLYKREELRRVPLDEYTGSFLIFLASP